jgi:hypothetical protein
MSGLARLVRKNRAVQNATVSAKSARRERLRKNVVSPVNAVRQRRGRPPKDRQAESDAGVLLRSENYSRVLSSRWDNLAPGLAQVKEAGADESVEKVTAVLVAAGFSESSSDGFPPLSVLAPRVLRVLRDKKYPKQRDSQITFLADALSGFRLEPRTAHELCNREREKAALLEARRSGNAIRHAIPVFDVECSCGYRGQSVNAACAECGAPVPPWWS